MENIDHEISAESLELTGDMPEVVVASASTFYDNKYTLEMSVEDDVLEAFSQMDKDQTIKKIRYLESADLHFEKIHVFLEKLEDPPDQEDLLAKLVKMLDKYVQNCY